MFSKHAIQVQNLMVNRLANIQDFKFYFVLKI